MPDSESPVRTDPAPNIEAVPRHHDTSSDSDITDTNSSDEFNWDDDDDFKSTTDEKVKAKRGRAVWLAFMKLARPVRVLLVSVLGATIFITPLLVVRIRFNSNPIRTQIYVWSLWLTIIWAAGCITYLVVDSIPRIVINLIAIFGGQVERLKTQLELTMAVSGWLKLALDISWAWISLSIIRAIYQPSGSYWVIINRVMQALFAAGIILLVEKLFLQFVAINFHEKALADRLAENRMGLKALDRLSNAQPSVTKKPPYDRRGTKNFTGPFGTSNDNLGMRRGHKDNLSSAEMSRMTNEKGDPSPVESKSTTKKFEKNVRSVNRERKNRKAVTTVIVDQLGGAIGQVVMKDSKFNKEGEIGGLYSARRLARKLFSTLTLVDPLRTHLVEEDFHPYFRTTAEAHDAFELFDKDGNGDITKREMREAVQRIYRERKALTASLKDVGSIVAKLDAVLIAIALVCIIFVCLLIFNRSNTLASLVPLATIILGFSFIFGHSAQTLFESLIFIFTTHVFDVGDLVLIDDQPLFVKEFGLFSTTFRRVDGQEIIAPNSLLASSKLVHNLRRSRSMWETTTLMVAYNTPLEVIEQLRTCMSNYVTSNSREWSGFALNIDKMEFQNAIHLIVAMEHRPNWQDWGGRWARRTAFMRHLKSVLEELDLRYTMPIQPVILPHSSSGAPRMQPLSPQHGAASSQNDLGNAGMFQGSHHQRSPVRSLRTEVDSFRVVDI